jgi:hypothetical protein
MLEDIIGFSKRNYGLLTRSKSALWEAASGRGCAQLQSKNVSDEHLRTCGAVSEANFATLDFQARCKQMPKVVVWYLERQC